MYTRTLAQQIHARNPPVPIWKDFFPILEIIVKQAQTKPSQRVCYVYFFRKSILAGRQTGD
jgi:hypothetical protein